MTPRLLYACPAMHRRQTLSGNGLLAGDPACEYAAVVAGGRPVQHDTESHVIAQPNTAAITIIIGALPLIGAPPDRQAHSGRAVAESQSVQAGMNDIGASVRPSDIAVNECVEIRMASKVSELCCDKAADALFRVLDFRAQFFSPVHKE